MDVLQVVINTYLLTEGFGYFQIPTLSLCPWALTFTSLPWIPPPLKLDGKTGETQC